ncbi:hypothetical protein [Grimontia hollisae]|uniref:Uncharacterized protein n=2 Tax=Grimontia hollisae TaxID=673 RepID=D0IBL1_GRIHO|nr:hypothetical protein [Grimontia hollisae]EEY71279.1 hypothetical protein VHA_003138 [Grimontia hollisae CIP 101886]MDF2184269.1 hypothetical protein [Grimontia hollisae]STO43683.1 Uncharacterised protein [Grimontia hollisae]STO57044.1 Uncharacterised protein [Grimontia hollisae]STQ74906.1 Uncharacterised protein [Grimontia hollisae]
MNWFPNISEYSPQKVGNVVKQDKTKQQQQKRAEKDEHPEEGKDKATGESKKDNDGLLDIYV